MDKCDFCLGTTTNWVIIEDVYNVLKTMEFCNKGMVRADPPHPVMVKDHKFTFFLDPSLSAKYSIANKSLPKIFNW